MTNKEIASHLREIAVYKEISGDNPFKVRAFDQAARAVESSADDGAVLAAEGALTRIKGVGRGIEEVILEFIGSGRSRELDALKSAYPPTLTDLLAIPGVGPKKVKVLWEKLGISTLGELEYACRENRLLALEGFGRKTQDNILKGLAFRKRYSEMHLYSEALAGAREAIGILERSGRFQLASIAGSLRRGKTYFKDVDVVLVPARGARVGDATAAVAALADRGEEGDGLIGAGDTKVSVRRGGLQMDFRIVPPESYPFSLQHFTGSKEHNVAMREEAQRRGLSVSEYGVTVVETGEVHTFRGEQELYAFLGYAFIPPELREDAGELEAARAEGLPALVELRDLRGEMHCHSTWSADGKATIEEMAVAAAARGYSFLCLTDHSHYLREGRLQAQWQEIEDVNARVTPFRVLRGIEANIRANGELDVADEDLSQLDWVVASLHTSFDRTPTERILAAIENPHVDCIGHLTGRRLSRRSGAEVDVERIVARAAETGTALEINAQPDRLDMRDVHARLAGEAGVRIPVTTDAHSVAALGYAEFGIGQARRAWLTREQVLNTRAWPKIARMLA